MKPTRITVCRPALSSFLSTNDCPHWQVFYDERLLGRETSGPTELYRLGAEVGSRDWIEHGCHGQYKHDYIIFFLFLPHLALTPSIAKMVLKHRLKLFKKMEGDSSLTEN